MFNSDVICEYPLKQMLDYHKARQAEGTILVTEVKDPSKYGVVVHEANGLINQFVEKPQTYVGNHINAGIYLLETKVLDRIQLRPTSIEREVFPHMARDKTLFCMALPGYWMDIGQPKDYLTGNILHLASIRKNNPSQLASGSNFTGNVLVHPSAKIGSDCLIGPDVVIGPNAVIEDGVRIKRSTLMDGVRVKKGAHIDSSIIGWQSAIGLWSHVVNSVLGEDVSVNGELYINDVMVCPHKSIADNIYPTPQSPKIIL